MRLTEVQTQSMESDYGKWVGVENMLMEGVEKWSRVRHLENPPTNNWKLKR